MKNKAGVYTSNSVSGNSLFPFLKNRLPFYYLIVVSLVSVAFGIVCEYEISSITLHVDSSSNSTLDENKITSNSSSNKKVTDVYSYINVLRYNDYTLTHPVVLFDIGEESAEMQNLKGELNSLIEGYKNQGNLESASIYVHDLNNKGWISINDDEKYHPASLLKLTVLLYYLKKSESHPEILDKTMTLGVNDYAPDQTFKTQSIKPSIPYKTSELLEDMIIHSDNYATLLLDERLDTLALRDLFKTLDIKITYLGDPDFSLSASDYSKLFRVLYNASYLNEKNSQTALWYLTQTDFNKGLMKPLPQGTVAAHKFGENSLRPLKELHESGIIYAGKNTYLLTVMTKGNNVKSLPYFIGDVSLKVYNYFSKK